MPRIFPWEESAGNIKSQAHSKNSWKMASSLFYFVDPPFITHFASQQGEI